MYALVGIAAGLSKFLELYPRLGAWVDNFVFRGRFPGPPNADQDWLHYSLVDGPIEETVELLAAALMLAFVLAFIQDLKRGDSLEKESVG